MRRIRAIINAVLVATLLKPMLRRSIARWRREARESAEATIVVPARELLEAALSARLASAASSPPPTSEEVADVAEVADLADVADVAGGSTLRTVLILGAVAALTAASAFAIAALLRRRRAAVTLESEATKNVVAVPVEVPAEESEAVDTSATASPSP